MPVLLAIKDSKKKFLWPKIRFVGMAGSTTPVE